MKQSPFFISFTVLVVSLPALHGCKGRDDPPGVKIVVGNSYLECVARDLCGERAEILCLAPPGGCPSHFDLTASQAVRLRGDGLILLFDFQKGLRGALSGLDRPTGSIQTVKAPSALCLPQSYHAVLKEVMAILSRRYPAMKGCLEGRMADVEKHLLVFPDRLRSLVRNSGLEGAAILVSGHQAGFADWLGLKVVTTFQGHDTASLRDIRICLIEARTGGGVRFVVANRQEGTSMATALAEQTKAALVVFDNFPDHPSGKGVAAFERLLLRNVTALTEAEAR